ncbi:glycine--tRNA ligase subunit beta [uncultured Granulicatella sp.]|jgi:glycyl-tRNA synthetase beta subunit|uniref:glycine--tRNA ligase subunit beta n=1 Tax=uncultured Granulicatella sp. TaxID=316089 RepID=UPI0028D4202E|nr:glycine--tRNA ligase subunit beta [uncultured Granulicatella sp.]
MTKSLLLEIGLEELPAQYVRTSSEQLATRVEEFFKQENLSFESVEAFATPRRLAVRVNGLEEEQEDRVEIFKGPSLAIAKKDGAWTKAAEGFVRGKGLTTDDIYVETIKDVEYIHVKQLLQGKSTKEVVKKLSSVITDMKFPVTMRWADHTFEYLRPIHWIVALYGEEVIEEIQVLDVKAGRVSRGHRFLGKDTEIATPEQYEQALAEQFVIVNQDERKALVRKQIEELAAKNAWIVPIDEELLEEVSSILEYPTAFAGTFDEKYLVVPEPVLVTSMKEHQRYFVVYNAQGELQPYFISARNGNDYMIENVAKGNQKVLTARLEDALFFYEEDKKVPMTAFLKKLETLNFHAKIGSMTEKMNRVQLLVGRIANELNLDAQDVETAQRAAEIYKFDLVTNMVGEFPELQGIMGEIYAKNYGETPEVARAIREHYMPISADGELPSSVPGALLAIADKLDTFLSFTAAGMLPTGSNDPYALRRQVMGLVQIVEAFDWHLEIEEFAKLLLGLDYVEFLEDKKEDVQAFVLGFILERLAQRMTTVTKRHDIIEAVLNSNSKSVPEQMKAVAVLEKEVSKAAIKDITEALNRVINISSKGFAEARHSSEYSLDKVETESERQLVESIATLRKDFENYSAQEKFSAFASITPKIHEFFNENMVMVDNEEIRTNRLRFLRELALMILEFADFTELIVK